MWGCAIWVWWIRAVPVSIETKTEVICFGNRQICGSGTVESVLVRSPSSLREDQNLHTIEFQLLGGTIASVASRSFASIGNFARGFALAEQMAAMLKVWVDYQS